MGNAARRCSCQGMVCARDRRADRSRTRRARRGRCPAPRRAAVRRGGANRPGSRRLGRSARRTIAQPWPVSAPRTSPRCWRAIRTGWPGSPTIRTSAARSRARCSSPSSRSRPPASRPPASCAAALRRVRGDELVRLGVRELELGLDTEVGRELSRLADACFDAAIAFHDAELRARYGPPRYVDDDGVERDAKLVGDRHGQARRRGAELRVGRRRDLRVLVGSAARPARCRCTSTSRSCARRSPPRCRRGRPRTTSCSASTCGCAPRARKGAIANSLAQLERYYETFGRPWERQAWIKARACAGDPRARRRDHATLRPFVFPRLTSPDGDRRRSRSQPPDQARARAARERRASTSRTATAGSARSSSSCRRCS